MLGIVIGVVIGIVIGIILVSLVFGVGIIGYQISGLIIGEIPAVLIFFVKKYKLPL